MQTIDIRKAIDSDCSLLVDIDYRLDNVEHVVLNRKGKITKAISDETCFVVTIKSQPIGFAIFDYRFFDQGWIELIIIDEQYRGKGIGSHTLNLLCERCKADKVFTSTNRSNAVMQSALSKAEFTFAGQINGLDDGDPELFYYKKTKS